MSRHTQPRDNTRELVEDRDGAMRRLARRRETAMAKGEEAAAGSVYKVAADHERAFAASSSSCSYTDCVRGGVHGEVFVCVFCFPLKRI